MTKVIITNTTPIVHLSISDIFIKYGYNVHGNFNSNSTLCDYIANHKVDLVLIDCESPSNNGFELANRLRKKHNDLCILIMGNRKNTFNVRQAINVGANGYFFNCDAIETMKNAFNCVLSGYAHFPMGCFNEKLFNAYSDNGHVCIALSIREIQVLKQLAIGKKSMHIAQDMNISFKTVSTYKHRIMQKLNLGSTMELLEYARAHGIT